MLHAVLLAGWLFAQGNPIVPPAPVTTHTDVNVTVQAPPPDPKAIADSSTQSFNAVVVNLIAPTAAAWVDGLMGVPDFIRQTPPSLSYDNDAVKTMQDIALKVALAFLAIVIFANGLAWTMGQRPPVGRLIFAVLVTLTELTWWRIGIDLVNGVNNAIAAPSTADIVRPHMDLPALGDDPVKAFAPAVLLIVYAIVALLLMLSMAFRLGMIDILIVLGPLGLLCGGTEQTQEWYGRYLGSSVGTLLSQIPVVIALKLAPIMGGLGSGVTGTLLGIVILLLARRMPAMMGSAGRDQGGHRGVGAAIMLLVRRFA